MPLCPLLHPLTGQQIFIFTVLKVSLPVSNNDINLMTYMPNMQLDAQLKKDLWYVVEESEHQAKLDDKSKEEIDADEEPTIQIALQVIVKKTTTNFAGVVLMGDEFANTSVWPIGKGSNPPTAKGKSLAACQACSQSWHCPSLIQDDPAPDAGPLVEEALVPPATLMVANPESSQMLDNPIAASLPSILPPSCVAHDQELQALKMEVTMLYAIVVAGNQLLHTAYTHLDAQDNHTDLPTGQITNIHCIVDLPSSMTPTNVATDECPDLAAGPANNMNDLACLPVTIKTPKTENSNVSGELAM
ncbi:hypothetical protein BDR06DRAFT_970290 [Suillus hirtellus]|nr:hypothetical protein BDR06DRAFT_970290 [Suillus hirtellus]